jgi:hypothetical protein
MEPQVKVLVPEIVAAVLFPPAEFKVTALVTANVLFTTSEAVVAAAPEKVIVLHVAPATVTVTVIPVLITTSSEAVGTAAPPHVAVLFQSPVTLAVLVAAFANETTNNKTIENTKVRNELVFSYPVLSDKLSWFLTCKKEQTISLSLVYKEQ